MNAPVIPPVLSDGAAPDNDAAQAQVPDPNTATNINTPVKTSNTPVNNVSPITPVNSYADVINIPSAYDIRNPNGFMPALKPYGSTFALDPTEVLRRGYMNMTADEQATIAAAYLSAQAQILSPFDTNEELEEKKARLEMDKGSHRMATIFKWMILIICGALFLAFVYLIIYFSSKGVLTDAGVINGVMQMFNDTVRAFFSGSKY